MGAGGFCARKLQRFVHSEEALTMQQIIVFLYVIRGSSSKIGSSDFSFSLGGTTGGPVK
jgi:hypothetical protein